MRRGCQREVSIDDKRSLTVTIWKKTCHYQHAVDHSRTFQVKLKVTRSVIKLKRSEETNLGFFGDL